MINVYLYSIANADNNFNLPDNINKHITNYQEKQKLVSAANYTKLNNILNDYNLDISHIVFSKLGKPLLKDLYLSLAHNTHFYGFAISLDQDIGIDIEDLTRFEDKHANIILNAAEIIDYHSNVNKQEYLALKWCEKEALGKMKGTGLNKSVLKEHAQFKKTFVLANNIVVIVSNQEIDEINLFIDDKKCEEF